MHHYGAIEPNYLRGHECKDRLSYFRVYSVAKSYINENSILTVEPNDLLLGNCVKRVPLFKLSYERKVSHCVFCGWKRIE